MKNNWKKKIKKKNPPTFLKKKNSAMPIDYRELGRAVFAATRAEQFDATLLQRIDEYVDQGYTPSVSAVAERLLNDFKVVQQQGMNDNQVQTNEALLGVG